MRGGQWELENPRTVQPGDKSKQGIPGGTESSGTGLVFLMGTLHPGLNENQQLSHASRFLGPELRLRQNHFQLSFESKSRLPWFCLLSCVIS